MAELVGINVDRLFTLTFALGSGLAALGGGLAIQLFGLSPSFAVLYLVLFLIVVAVGGLGSLKGTLLAALVLGVFDTAGKYLHGGRRRLLHLRRHRRRPSDQAGGVLWPRVTQRAPAARSQARERAADYLISRHRFRLAEALPWLIALAAYFLFPDRMTFGGQVLIMVHVRALARPDPWLCGNRDAWPCRLLRHRRLYGRPRWPRGCYRRADYRAVCCCDCGRPCRLHHRLVPAALSRPDAADAHACDGHHAAGDRQSALGHFRRL